MDFIQKADAFAAEAHAGQRRKFGDEPYIEHPRRVERMIRDFTKDPAVRAAALLHDVIEDCGVRQNALSYQFTPRVADYVDWLSDKVQPDWNRATRKAWQAGRLHCAPYWVQSIKVCDLIDNTRDIVKHDPGFAKVYLDEKEVLLASLTNCVKSLHLHARLQLQASRVTLGI